MPNYYDYIVQERALTVARKEVYNHDEDDN